MPDPDQQPGDHPGDQPDDPERRNGDGAEPEPRSGAKPEPPQLHPARVNVKALFLAGTAAWLAGLVGFGVAVLAERSPDPLIAWICLAGILFGAAGYWWVHIVHLVDEKGMSE